MRVDRNRIGRRAAAALALLAALAGPARAQQAPAPVPSASDPGPVLALRALERAYAGGSVAALDSLLAADFVFLSPGARPEARLPGASGRADELAAARDLFAGAADSVRLGLDGLVEGADPEHADSTRQYRTVAVQRLAVEVGLGAGRALRSGPSLHVFQLARGDVAALAPGAPADSTRWYLRRWFEDADRVAAALARVRGDCALEDRQAPPPEPPEDTTAARFEAGWVDSAAALPPDSMAAALRSGFAAGSSDAAIDSAMAPADTEAVAFEDEDLAGEEPAEESPDLAAADSSAGPAPGALRVEPLGEPSCPTLDVRCDLPGAEPARLEIYDVTGRRVQRVELGIRAPVSLRVQAGAGVSLAPGVYWLRLSQSGRADARMVAVAR